MWEVTPQAMSQRLHGLKPDEENPKRYKFLRALGYMQSRTKDGEVLDPIAERARLQKAQADHQEMVNATKRGELLDAAECERDWLRVLTEVKTNLLSIPRKAAPLLVGVPSIPEIEQHLDDAIRDGLARAVEAGEGAAGSAPAAAADRQPVGRHAPQAQSRVER